MTVAVSQTNKATAIGFVAIILWSALVALIRSVSEHFGAIGGAALMYSLAALFLLPTQGWVSLRSLPRAYLLWGSLLFVAYELCFALSIAWADTARQAIEVGMVNYLWPTLTIVSAIFFAGRRATVLIVPGFILSMTGVCLTLGGDEGFSTTQVAANILSNPLSYGMALAGALIWAAYCTVTIKLAQGKNAITLFFVLVAASLWGQYGLATDPFPMQFSAAGCVYLLLAAGAMGFGYAAWNIGILHGNVMVLAGASYFIPVLSALLSALLLSATLPWVFWQGAGMVCVGSLLCWFASLERGGKGKKRQPGRSR